MPNPETARQQDLKSLSNRSDAIFKKFFIYRNYSNPPTASAQEYSPIAVLNSEIQSLLEIGIEGIQRASTYYCDPMRSGQKGGVEHAYTLLRRVLPKGTSFEFLTQWDVNLIVNHINSIPRESLGGETPYEAALKTLGEDILKAFQLKPIAPDEVI